ncbi:MAG: YggT family protein [Candidatus Cloacimonadaceae bacterium]|jgi:YggT family protein|nr:YggT family protein [Candidatus Cloacimonadota bacterium]MDY0127112.1 YggT family protein [Candidatus Cloacimonadaceae bacterium]MCB5255342.1 YggT family protein [Candidatus Cloacimonadota bacterium]MCK9178985.1 YggT family protein [Candidatus Cloacimonadota bacterium]MCK9242793.1 YggT family protein [Candidatus Cloacimonadota bacterium]
MANPVTTVLIRSIVNLIAIYNLIILARVISSWIIRDPSSQILRFLYAVTEPILGPIRNIMPNMGLDFSPIVAYLLLNILRRILISIL